LLAGDGAFVVQAGPLSPPELGLHARLVRTVRAVFPNTVSYGSHVPSYASPWGFVIGSAKPIDTRPDPAAVDALLAESTTGRFRMFDGGALLAMMQTPKHIREAIDAETRIYTLADPPRAFGPDPAGP
jgi:spermidine synthase